jgi:small GTP-binding protein
MGNIFNKQINTTNNTSQFNNINNHYYDNLYNVLIIGDELTGKSSLISKYVHNICDFNIKPTIGIDSSQKIITYSNIKNKLQIWDASGKERMWHIIKPYIKHTDFLIFVYDTTNKKTLDNINKYLQYIGSTKVRLLLVANKCDIGNNIYIKQGEELASKYNMEYVETSVYNDKLFNNFRDKIYFIISSFDNNNK